MRVFSAGWIDQIKNRYERQQKHQRPEIYFVATSDKYKELRNEVEEWVADFPKATQNKLIPKLQSSENSIQNIYHELAVGNMLKKLGFQIEYEKKVDGLTPDWYIQPKDKTPAFIVEVSTVNPSEETKKSDKQVVDLLSRLKQIPVGVNLNINFNRDKVVLDPKLNKTISKKVGCWLLNENPSVGAQLDLNGVVFEIILFNDKFRRVQPMGASYASFVNSKHLRKKIKKKISRYKKQAKMGIPLVIAAVANPEMGYDFENFKEALIKLNTKKELSAAIWVGETESSEREIKAIHNPAAMNPLPNTTFDKK